MKKKSNSKTSKEEQKVAEKSFVSKIMDSKFVKNIFPKVLPLILIFFVMFFAFYIRSAPDKLRGIEEISRQEIYNYVGNIINYKISLDYPNLNQIYQSELYEKEFQNAISNGYVDINGERIMIEEEVQKRVQLHKESLTDDNGQVYLNAIDPYHFYRLGEIYQENGYMGTSIVTDEQGNQKPMIDYKLAPKGFEGSYTPDLQTWLFATIFRFKGYDENTPVGYKTASVYYIPVIIILLSIIPMFLIIRKFSSNIFAFFGSLLCVSIGTVTSRTVAGFTDTDGYNILFPLLILLFLIYSLSTEKRIFKIIYAFLASLFTTMYIWAWPSGWFMYMFVIISIIAYYFLIILYKKIILKSILKDDISKFKKTILSDSIIALTYAVLSFVLTYIFLGFNLFTLAYDGFSGSMSDIATVGQSNIWPNVYSSVAELNPASFEQILSTVGGSLVTGKIVLVIAMFALLMLVFNAFKGDTDKKNKLIVLASIIWFLIIINLSFFVNLTVNNPELFIFLLFLPIGISLLMNIISGHNNFKVFLSILLALWMSGTIYMSFHGVRFILLLAPAFSIAFAIGLYYISFFMVNIFGGEFENRFSGRKLIGLIIVTIFFTVLFIPVAQTSDKITKSTLPNFDDSWYNAMYKIENETSKSAIITSWWDFGHFFAAISKRGVTFDGGTQTNPVSHWVGRFLLENDEHVAEDILKMLVCSSNDAYYDFYKMVGKNEADSIKILRIINRTFGHEREEKQDILKNNGYYDLTDDQVEKILNNLDCKDSKESIVIASGDMIPKAGVWAHWGLWDFEKKYVYNNYLRMSSSDIAHNIDIDKEIVDKYVEELKSIDIRSKVEGIKKDDLLNYWFAPYPRYLTSDNQYMFNCQVEGNETISCLNGNLKIDAMTGNITKNNLAEGFTVRNIYVPSKEDKVLEIEQDSNGRVDMILMNTASGFAIMFAEPPLANSLFSKMYFMNGSGLTKFEKFIDENGLNAPRITVWKSDLS